MASRLWIWDEMGTPTIPHNLASEQSLRVLAQRTIVDKHPYIKKEIAFLFQGFLLPPYIVFANFVTYYHAASLSNTAYLSIP